MRTRYAAIALALTGAALAPATAQQPGASNAQYDAEREAAKTAIIQAEKLFNAGERGPDSETCKLMDAYFLHIVKAAAAAGVKTRVTEWEELTREEQDAVAKQADPQNGRNRRLRQVACTDKPR